MKISNPTAKLGEEIATNYLKNKGYKIIERNFRKGYGEIDIIAIKDNILIFVEVKTRTTALFGGALESIAYHKIKSLIKTAQFYKILHPKLPEAMRIDAILIDLSSNNQVSNIEHIENISGF
ncbi:MAG: YraN family protein [Patescibacteria group bacterium]|nr:YraN family protein [Patescibacteria group bacterium]